MKVYILPEVHAEIMYYVRKSSIEISGLGRVEKDSEGNMCVTKVYLLKQENAAASTDICEHAAAELLYEKREDKGDLNFWWHSHVDMGVFWSGTDMATIKQFGSKGYLLSTVFNKKGEHRTSYFQGSNGFLPELFIDAIATEFTYLPTKAQQDTWEKEYEAKCTRKTYNSWTSGGRRWNSKTGKWENLDGTPWENPSKQTTGIGDDYYYGRNYGHGYGRDWDDDDGFIPSAYKDPNYYTTEPVTTKSASNNVPAKEIPIAGDNEEVFENIGALSGASVDEMIDTLKRLFYQDKVPKIDELEANTYLEICDAYLLVHGLGQDEFDDKAAENFYNQTVCNYNNLLEVEFDLREAQYFVEEKGEAV